ncbi:MAG: 50S ribosomal protein L20, partial [Victivallaceae bacterium]|nr:50S ribosomal protein L20 [Victivallaceae bacterium]
MARVTPAVASRKRRKRVLEQAKGFRGASSKQIRTVYDAVDKAMTHAFEGRKQKKRLYRRLWTARINAACRANGTNYSKFING